MSKTTMTIDEFSEEFKSTYDKFYTALKTLINNKYKQLNSDAILKSFDDAKIDMEFKDPESGQTGTVIAAKLVDIPFMSMSTFEEQSNGKIENIDQFFARINIAFTNKFIAVAKEILGTLENKNDYRLFSKFTSKTQDGSFELYLIYNGVKEEVSGESVVTQYNKIIFETAEIEGTKAIDPKEFPKFDTSMSFKIPVEEIKQHKSSDDIFTILSEMYTDKFVKTENNIFESLKKKFIQSKNNLRRVTYDLMTEREEIYSAILARINKISDGNITGFVKSKKVDKYGDVLIGSTMVVKPIVFTINDNVFVAISSIVNNIFVILEIDAVYTVIKNGKLRVICYPVCIADKELDKKYYALRKSFPVVEYWKALHYIYDSTRVETHNESFEPATEFDVIECGKLEPIDTTPHHEQPKLWQDKPEYVNNDLVEVSTRLNSTVHGLNGVQHKSMSFEKIANPRIAANKVTLGVLHGLDVDKTDPTYLSIENAVELIKSQSGVLKDIELVCESTNVVGQGSIKFIGVLKD